MRSAPSIIPDLTHREPRRASLAQRLARSALCAALERIEQGELRLIDADGEYRFGRQGTATPLRATLRICDPGFYAETEIGRAHV